MRIAKYHEIGYDVRPVFTIKELKDQIRLGL